MNRFLVLVPVLFGLFACAEQHSSPASFSENPCKLMLRDTASPEEFAPSTPESMSHWLLKISFSASDKETLSADLASGRRLGPIACKADGTAYPLPGYVSVTDLELRQGIRFGFSGKSTIAAFAYESDIGTVTLVYPSNQSVALARLSMLAGQVVRPIELPIAPFMRELKDSPELTDTEIGDARDRLLNGNRRDLESAGYAITGVALFPIALLTLPAATIWRDLPDPTATSSHWRVADEKTRLVATSQLHLASFGYQSSSAERWIVESEPAGARIMGLEAESDPTTNTTIENLRGSDAVKLSMAADGYRPCRFSDAQQSIVSRHGLQWIRLFCKLSKNP